MPSRGRYIIHLAKQAAPWARTEPAALQAAKRPLSMRAYRGVQVRHNKRYGSLIWYAEGRRSLWLGSYNTPEEAAYAWDAAARIIHGHRAKPNFPEPLAALAPLPPPPAVVPVPAPTVSVVTDLSLALQPPQPQPQPANRSSYADSLLRPASAAAAPHQPRAPAAAALLQRRPTVPPFTQFFCLADTATAAAAPVNPPPPGPSMPSPGAAAYVLTAAALKAPIPFPPANPASSALSSTHLVDTSLSLSLSCSASSPTDQHRKRKGKQPMFLAGGSDSEQAVVGDNFTNGGASSSSAARRPVPPLRLKDLLEIDLSLGLGGPGGAQ